MFVSIVFLRTATDHGPRTIVFTTNNSDARLLSARLVLDKETDVPAMVILPDRPAYASVAQILAQRKQDKTPQATNVRMLRP